MAHSNFLKSPILLGFFKMALQARHYPIFIEKFFIFFYFSIFSRLMCHKCHILVFSMVLAILKVPWKCHGSAMEVPYLFIFTFFTIHI
jgi:hypothetical protein